MGDQSDFVNAVSRVLGDAGPRLGAALSELHFRFLCDKLAASFCPRFYDYIFRYAPDMTVFLQERVSNRVMITFAAGESLLLDLAILLFLNTVE